MTKLSRRTIAVYAADQLLNGKPAKTVAKDLSALLVASARQKDVDFLLEDIAWELEERKAVVTANITTTDSLNLALENEIKRLLEAATGSRQISLENTIDKSVIGGVRIATATKVWDFTVSRKLSELREAA